MPENYFQLLPSLPVGKLIEFEGERFEVRSVWDNGMIVWDSEGQINDIIGPENLKKISLVQ